MSIKAPAKLHVEKEKEEEEDPDKDLSPGLRAYRQLSSKTLGEQSLKEQRILRHMEEVRAQVSSRIQHVGKSLEQHFRSIPVEQLTAEIAKRFKYYDKDGNGTLDRYEIIEAMAEMGSRPSETEVNEFFALFDTDKNGTIEMDEFDQMIRLKLGLISQDDIVHHVHEHEAEKELDTSAEDVVKGAADLLAAQRLTVLSNDFNG
mmetsp:Transcript_51296/g.104340  ORF Transcript_51296/g.104340 Transcript_51296/m.104340 type:complete len:203 (+) Transcript_51296:123-731(+)|eukprot:CAMPEP_0181320768 /NCGR_PEP_ID=MMETSP1101-20121128/18303_1 /TAXON_ID=46948 /ORGANISM="Rhodomonas abbreviata, Strain Caron Lab Isolate" /LENGTH=202 /DNA_ID=CAMNT_0023428501 /DNA_START=121 /DNA_END=729 /DNA_ORIENTATION=-